MILYLIILLGLISGWLATSGKKSQFIRLLDVFYIGPLMIYFSLIYPSSQNYRLDCILKYSLAFLGATTITYNLKNFILTNKKLE
jgi:uncharacterized membrane protein